MDLPEIKFEIDVNLYLLKGVFVTAIEGGSDYWCYFDDAACKKVDKYITATDAPRLTYNCFDFKLHRTFSEAVFYAIMAGEKIPIHDCVSEEFLGVLSLNTIQDGIDTLIRDNRHEITALFLKDEIPDAHEADVLFQYFVFGELVFG